MPIHRPPTEGLTSGDSNNRNEHRKGTVILSSSTSRTQLCEYSRGSARADGTTLPAVVYDRGARTIVLDMLSQAKP